MDHSETAPDHVAKIVCWPIALSSFAFILGVIILNPLVGVFMQERYLTAASTYAHSIDHLFILIAVIVGVWLIAAEGMLFALIFKFRAKDGRPTQYVTGEETHLKRWISIPHYMIIVCDIVILAAAISVWYNIKQVGPPAADETVRVIGQQWAWEFSVRPGRTA